MKLPSVILQLIESFKRLPGIGDKTALRLALFVIDDLDLEDVEQFSESLLKTKTNLSYCEICGCIKEDLCPICTDENRDQDKIMVIETIKDLITIENTKSYFGLYHILNGVIDFSRGVEPEDVNIDSLIKRAKDNKEIVLALSGTISGQLTSNYIQELLIDKDVTVTKLAQGIPIGVDLAYADVKTLSVALANRVNVKKE